MMQLFDTYQRQLKQLNLTAQKQQTFRLYCCGPTVYGPAHIGNFRTFIVQDSLRRWLQINGVNVEHVRNITDVDDKTIAGAIAAKKGLVEYTQPWLDKFRQDCQLLNCLPPSHEPKATDYIAEQIAMIVKLLAKGHAYVGVDQSVYFKVSSFSAYGQLSQLANRELQLGIASNNQIADNCKENVADFVLWKAHKAEDGENFWQSPWGKGRPGWHLECSAMAAAFFGDSFDMHAGGEDLIFPHHENEIAQSCCCYGGNFAEHWFHSSHLLVDGKKMSKSLGNFYVLDDILTEGFQPRHLRFSLLSAHYRKQLNFKQQSLHAAEHALQKLSKYRVKFGCNFLKENIADDLAFLQQSYSDIKEQFAHVWQPLYQDFNVPLFVGELFKQLANTSSHAEPEQYQKLLYCSCYVLGVVLADLSNNSDAEQQVIPSDILALAEQRQLAKQQKKWQQADDYRDQIQAQGWLIKDGVQGFELVKNKDD